MQLQKINVTSYQILDMASDLHVTVTLSCTVFSYITTRLETMIYKRINNYPGKSSSSPVIQAIHTEHISFNPFQTRITEMKTTITIIGTVLLAAASTTLAAPSNFKRALQPLQIKNMHGYLYTETPPTSNNIAFALNDPNTNIDTDCNAVWYV